jgi:hypothetical protein
MAKPRRRKPAAPKAAPPIAQDAQATIQALHQRAQATIQALHQQVEIARSAFFTLAQRRAADRVQRGESTWDDGAAYINAEVADLDRALAGAVPQENDVGC